MKIINIKTGEVVLLASTEEKAELFAAELNILSTTKQYAVAGGYDLQPPRYAEYEKRVYSN